MSTGEVFLIPTFLHNEEKMISTLSPMVTEALTQCSTFFAENIKTARRHIKTIQPNFVIDDYEWIPVGKAENEVVEKFLQLLKADKKIGIISEAGCPGIADPGQFLVEAAQKIHAKIHPLVGPSSILLSLMASGMNGQNFHFHGYLPFESLERKKTLLKLELDSRQNNCTHIFIETPYRNRQLISDVIGSCANETKLCVAIDITASTESIITQSVKDWKKVDTSTYHKRPAIFLLDAGNNYQPKNKRKES